VFPTVRGGHVDALDERQELPRPDVEDPRVSRADPLVTGQHRDPVALRVDGQVEAAGVLGSPHHELPAAGQVGDLEPAVAAVG
jgi:hypothetical protein